MFKQRAIVVCIVLSILVGANCSIEEEEHGVVYANRCEACKILAIELEARLQETGKSHDVIEVGYDLSYQLHIYIHSVFYSVFQIFQSTFSKTWHSSVLIQKCAFIILCVALK